MTATMPDIRRSLVQTARAQALFVSPLQRSDSPSTEQIRRAVADSVMAFGTSGLAARTATAFGDYPETAVMRMRWAIGAVAECWPRSVR